MTPRSKHYAIKYHWFREHIGPRHIELGKISSENQLGDLFTKGLDHNIFQRLRKKLMSSFAVGEICHRWDYDLAVRQGCP